MPSGQLNVECVERSRRNINKNQNNEKLRNFGLQYFFAGDL